MPIQSQFRAFQFTTIQIIRFTLFYVIHYNPRFFAPVRFYPHQEWQTIKIAAAQVPRFIFS